MRSGCVKEGRLGDISKLRLLVLWGGRWKRAGMGLVGACKGGGRG